MNNKNSYEGKISKAYIKKETLKNNLVLLTAAILIEIWYFFMYLFNTGFTFELYLILTIFTVILPYVVIAIISRWYFAAYVRNFAYKVQETNIIIYHGVFTKIHATIPYKRIQNINTVSGIFDRIFKTNTIKIETAGHSIVGSSAKSRGIGPEGYIPGLKDPYIIENKIKERITQSSLPAGMFEDKIFKPEELAFDNFISYILSKMREGELLQTSIKELRNQKGLSVAKLAEDVGVPVQTITYLEEGRFNPSLTLAFRIATVLDCKIEDLFKLA